MTTHHDVTTILVTSAGTASAISVVKALKRQTEVPVRVVAVDMDRLAAGLYLADAYYLVPSADTDSYIPTLLDIARKEGASILIPIYSKEMAKVAKEAAFLAEQGLRTLLPAPEVIAQCNDKRGMYAFAQRLGVPCPRTYSREELSEPGAKLPFPLFAKPNSSSSSSGAFKISSQLELAALLAKESQDLVVQEYIKGDEVTVDVLCDRRHEPFVIAPRLRLSTKAGQSVKGQTIAKDPFVEPVSSLTRALKLVGACNMQFFLTAQGLRFIEINPRYAAGGLMLTVEAGANIPLLVVKEIKGLPIAADECVTSEKMYMTRYWEEVVIKWPLE